MSETRTWESLEEGAEVPAVSFPLSVFRLVLAAGSTRDMNAIHHNHEVAQGVGAPDIFANAIFLTGMWERTVRDFIGVAGVIRSIRGFRMRGLNVAGDTVTVRGTVRRKWLEAESALAELELWSECFGRVTVGPGTVTVELPRADDDE